MTTRSPSPRPDDFAIPDAAAVTGLATPPPDPGTRPDGPPEKHPEPTPGDSAPPHGSVPPGDSDPFGDPLYGLLHTAVADRPLEDVVRLISLLDGSPEHARATADALRAAGIGRPVEDVMRLVTLLAESPRGTGNADEAIRAAAERRPVEDVSRLMELLRRTPLEPHCGQAAVEAAAGRPVEDIAELVGRLVAERARREAPPPDATLPVPVVTAPMPVVAPPAAARTGKGRADPRGPAARTATAALWGARFASLMTFLCGVAHAPRYWTGPSHGVLGATIVVSALCVLLAMALPSRASAFRLLAAAGAFMVTAVLAAGHVLAGRFGLPNAARIQAAVLAPPWIAGALAAAAAIAALAVLLTTLTTANGRHGERR
ncbi:hypothetical protein [Streptomyces sp. L2]|uniref:hypothetical protein n=1 Tax=Streptomyces sp. L2 TaxID=2162665 RepID=UPI001F5153A5|nr:hypothetical protein [Streptomyces sp. L2]